jgi:CheY-like chemotaxis protein
MTNILYVDDDESNRIVFVHSFSSCFKVATCSSGAEAIERVTRAPPEVVVTDQRMPGMTGIELLERVRQVSPATRRLMLTAYDDPEVKAHNGVGGCGCIEHHFMKPFDRAEVTRVVVESVAEMVGRTRQAARDVTRTYDAIFAADEERRRQIAAIITSRLATSRSAGA